MTPDPGRFAPGGELPQRSLALEASAGTGKTWTLTSLTVRYVAEDDVPLPELLLVTFTRAATAELRDRVRTRLAEVIEAIDDALADDGPEVHDDPVLDRVVGDARRFGDGGGELRARRGRLRRAQEQLDEATISTIHGFCQRMLHHTALEAGVDFDATLLEDDGALIGEVVDDHLARELRPAEPAWVRYLKDAADIGRDRLTQLAREVASLPELRLLPTDADVEGPCTAPWDDAVEAFGAWWSSGGREAAVELIAELHRSGAFASPRQRTYTPNAAKTRADAVDAWLAEDRALPPGRVRGGRTPHNTPGYPMAYFTAAAIEPWLGDEALPADHAVLAHAQRILDAAGAPATIFLYRAAVYFWHELERRKRRSTVLTHDDLLRRLADALEDPTTRDTVRASIRQRYRVALIDEFQDTDAVQWRIFSTLFGTDEPFVLIGDPKQAIYGFRGADVHTYVHARDTRPEQRTLAINRRSDETYVTACNVLFGQPAAFATDDIPYHPIDAHHGDRLDDPAGSAALRLRYVHRSAAPTGTDGSTPTAITKGWLDRVLPDDVVAEVVAHLDGTVTFTADGRPLAPRDLAVLVRTNRRADAVQRALVAAGVPAVIQRGGSVYATDEAEELQRLLVAMGRPANEHAAVAAAATRLFGRDAPTLLAQRDELGPGEGDPASWDAWVDALTRWGERWRSDGVLTAIRAAFTEEGVVERLLATAEGERRVTNLRHLAELLHAAEADRDLTTNRLVEWLRTRRVEAAEGEQPDAETELRLEADAEAVRVVTVHGSKGLQYPVVLCPDLWDGRIRTGGPLIRFHDPDVGDPRRAMTLDLDADTSSAGKERSRQVAEGQERAEQLRLAYVALTRAEHRCVVWWGPFNDAATSPLASLLHGGDEADPEARFAGAADRLAADDDAIVGDLQGLVNAGNGSIAVEVARQLRTGAVWEADAPAPPRLAPRRFTRGEVDRTWRRTSFTNLVAHHTAGDDAPDDPFAGRDVDAETFDGTGDSAGDGGVDGAGDGGVDVPLTRFPRGAGPGTFLHDVLERADPPTLASDGAMDRLLSELERRHGIGAEHRPAVITGLRAAATTPIGSIAGGARLADIDAAERLCELRFEFPLAGGLRADRPPFVLDDVAAALDDATDPQLVRYAGHLRRSGLHPRVRGFLTGSIDLVARLPVGRFLVADYKSNFLGDPATPRSTVADYHPHVLAASMRERHYVLQALLYLVATHRYLRWRVPDYTFDTHVAGAAYLFLRGMTGAGHTTADGEPFGVAALRPDGATIARLSAVLEGGHR